MNEDVYNLPVEVSVFKKNSENAKPCFQESRINPSYVLKQFSYPGTKIICVKLFYSLILKNYSTSAINKGKLSKLNVIVWRFVFCVIQKVPKTL